MLSKQYKLTHLPKKVHVYFNIVLNGHGNELDNLAAVPVYRTNVCHAKHYQFFILVDMKFVPKVVGTVGNRV